MSSPGSGPVGRRRGLHLDLRVRMVLLTSAAVVVTMLLLGGSLLTVLSRSLYQEQQLQGVQVTQRVVSELHRALSRGRLRGLAGVQAPPSASPTVLSQILTDIGAQGSNPAFTLLLVTGGHSFTSAPQLSPPQLPTALVRTVEGNSTLAYVYVRNPYGPGRALLVGAPVAASSGRYQAYLYFPMTFQEHTLTLVTRILLTVGTILLGAMVVVTLFIAGRVLRPLRAARDVAERVAGGDLGARIAQANSYDDFGRLADSFNRMTDALALKIGELEQLSSLQARFVSDVSHELRTPLSTVRMAADYIHAARAGLPAEAQRAAILLQRELERFESLLEDLLEISRFDAGVAVLDALELDVPGLLAEVLESLDALAHGRHVELILQVQQAGGRPAVVADPRRLERVFANLVKNAIEHTEGGRVLVEVRRDNQQVLVVVSDEGEGIPEEALPHVFERFYRADVHRARIAGGTGLGLAIALENVHLHGGVIEVTSAVGRGSCFVVRLPAAPDRVPALMPSRQTDVDDVGNDGAADAEAVSVAPGGDGHQSLLAPSPQSDETGDSAAAAVATQHRDDDGRAPHRPTDSRPEAPVSQAAVQEARARG